MLAIVAPTLAIVVWGLLAAPQSRRRLRTGAHIPFELSVFGVAVVALLLAGAPVLALVLTLLVATSTALIARFDQWEA